MPKGITAEIGRWLGFAYDKGPPRIWTIGWVVICVHGGVVLQLGKWTLALQDADSALDAKDAEIARLKAELERVRRSARGNFWSLSEVAKDAAKALEGSNDR